MESKCIELMPHFWAGCPEMEALMRTEQKLIDWKASLIQSAQLNMYIQTADSDGLARYELVFGITAAPNETLSFRRTRLLNRLALTPPFTLRFLYDRLNYIIGPGRWEAYVDYAERTLYISSAVADVSWYQELRVVINMIKPANMVYVYRPKLTQTVAVNETVKRAKTTWNYRLGLWALGAEPFADFQILGVIKTANVQSLTPKFLGDLATFTVQDIATVRINGTQVLPEDAVTKTPVGNTATLSYRVPAAPGTAITRVEVLNTDGHLLSNMLCYVPLDEEVELHHTIQFQDVTIAEALKNNQLIDIATGTIYELSVAENRLQLTEVGDE